MTDNNDTCNDDCCQVAFCTICELVMQPIDYLVDLDTNTVAAVRVECTKCGQVGLSGIVEGVIVGMDTEVLNTAVIRAMP